MTILDINIYLYHKEYPINALIKTIHLIYKLIKPMNQKGITGAAPVSKYAAKKRVNNASVESSNDKTMETIDEVKNEVKVNAEIESDVKTETKQTKDITEVKRSNVNKGNNNGYRNPKFYQKNEKGLPAITDKFPEHQVRIALLLKNNAEIRRFTALGILNYLSQKGEITGDSRYVEFKWNKFAVKSNGLMREYSYGETFFLTALVASFSSFSSSAQQIIDHFCRIENNKKLNDSVNIDEVNDLVEDNLEHQNAVVDIKDDND